MERGAVDRGVSEVIGFILIFGFLVASFTIYQGLIVPEQNRAVEFEHNKEVQGDVQGLRNAIVETAATGTGRSVSIDMGATYPTRTIAQNLGFSAGAVRTEEVGTGNIHLENAEALDSETDDYLDGSDRSFGTKSIRYVPIYSFYSTAPNTIYENTLVFNRFDGENITLTDQLLVDGRRITVITVNGSLDASRQGTLSVSPEAISASSNRVAIENTSAGPVNVTIPTHLSASKWEEILDEEMDPAGTDPDAYVRDVTEIPGQEAVKLEMQSDVTYELRMAKVGVGSATATEGPAYITDVSGNGTSVPENGSQKLVVEVRDQFNNPVSNVTVSLANSPSWGAVSHSDLTTDTDGRATFTYSATGDVNQLRSDTVEIEFDGDGTDNETATFELEVLDSDGSGGGGGGNDGVDEVNPGDTSGDIIWAGAVKGGSNNDADVTFNNTGSTTEIVEVRIPFYYADQSDKTADAAEFFNTTGTSVGTFDVGSTMKPLSDPIELDGGGTESTFKIKFTNDDGNTPQVDRDFFIMVVQLKDGTQNSYFITVSQ